MSRYNADRRAASDFGARNPVDLWLHRPASPTEALYLKEAEASARRLLAQGVPPAEVRRRILKHEL